MTNSFPPPPPPAGQPSTGWATLPGSKPSSYLALAVLSTIFCCMPLGIVSIVNAARVDVLWMAGRHAEAQRASDKAKHWAIASIALIVGLVVLYFLVIAVLIGAAGE